MRFLTLRSFLCSLALHTVVLSALVIHFDARRRPAITPRLQGNIVESYAAEDKEELHTGFYIPTSQIHSLRNQPGRQGIEGTE